MSSIYNANYFWNSIQNRKNWHPLNIQRNGENLSLYLDPDFDLVWLQRPSALTAFEDLGTATMALVYRQNNSLFCMNWNRSQVNL